MNAELLAGNIAAHWAQAGLLAAAAIMAIRCLHLNEPRARLAALHGVLAGILLLPMMQPWRVTVSDPQRAPAATIVEVSTVVSQSEERVPAAVQWPTAAQTMFAVIIAGIVTRLSWLFYGIVALARFSRDACQIRPPAPAGDLEAALQVSPRYVQQSGSGAPWTFGLVRPTVVLPAGFDAVLPEFQRAVICHELIHVKRRDIAVAFLEEIAFATLWFHPWMWLLRARIRVAREQVVDSCVVTMLGNRDDYVRCLVNLSGHDLGAVSHAGAGMLRPRELRSRVDAMFHAVPRSRVRLAAATLTFAVVTIATGLLAVAAMPLRARSIVPPGPSAILFSYAAPSQSAVDAPRKQVNRVYPEYPPDALERGIKGVVIVAITINAAGDVTTAAVASGPQELRASAFKAALGLRYTPATSTTAMQIAFEYLLTGTTWGVKIGEALPNIGLRPMPANTERRTEPVQNPDATGAYRIGGSLTPPKKIKDAPPEYPDGAQEARVQGVVIMEARVDENGNVSDVRVLRSIPLLDQAAIDAVRQWQYTPTLMNGVPVPVLVTVTVSFTLRKLIELHAVLPDGSSTVIRILGNTPVEIRPGLDARFHLRATVSEGANEAIVSVLADDGETHLGDLTLVTGGPVVQTPTNPSVGLQFLGLR